MTLILEIAGPPGKNPGDPRQVFSEEGGTIGRAGGNLAQQDALQPYFDGRITQAEAYARGIVPFLDIADKPIAATVRPLSSRCRVIASPMPALPPVTTATPSMSPPDETRKSRRL